VKQKRIVITITQVLSQFEKKQNQVFLYENSCLSPSQFEVTRLLSDDEEDE